MSSKSPTMAKEDWDLETDEIASIASEELYENRPNRWTGAGSTWRHFTEEERQLWNSMEQLRNQDLAVHLFNTFALKRQGLDPQTAQDLVVKTDDGQDAIWAPPNIWTAWPLKEKHLPEEGLLKRQNDEDEYLTFRRKEVRIPSSDLQEELSATILRLAKVRFFKRKNLKPAQLSIEDPAIGRSSPADEETGYDSQAPSVATSAAMFGDEEESMQDEEDRPETDDNDAPKPSRSRAATAYNPTISTNDDLSYELLRPSARHILSQLDDTLRVLHNARTSGLSYLSDSSTEDDSDSQSSPRKSRSRSRSRSYHASSPQSAYNEDLPAPQQTAPITRKRGRPRRTPRPEDIDTAAVPKPSRRGRPRKVHVPREGETHEDMVHRIAREGHRRLPWTKEEKDTAAFEEWLRRGDEEMARTPGLLTDKRYTSIEPPPRPAEDMQLSREERLRNWGLRDWSDVIGAAALAGFPSEVIARTTKRCADLFGQGMEIRRLNELPVYRGPGFDSMVYHPEQIRPSQSEPDDESADEAYDIASLTQRRIASRQNSLSRLSQGSESERSRGVSPALKRRSQSRSPSHSSAGLFFCSVSSCERAANGFSRKGNLARHMQVIHPGHEDDRDDEDSDDEMHGAVHVDGFLKPIQPGKGWRGDDSQFRRRKRFYGGGEEPLSGALSRASSPQGATSSN